MEKRKVLEASDKITVDILELQALLSVGRHTAEKIAREAGAAVRFGKRIVYNRRKIENYIDNMGA